MHEVGRPGSTRHLCLACAEAHDGGAVQAERGLNLSAVLVCVGAFGLFISVFADWLALGRSGLFGVWQLTGLAMGGVLLLTGAMVRILTVALIGLCVIVLTLLAEWVGLGTAPGFGVHQVTGTIISVLAILIGAVLGPLFTRRRTSEH